MDFFNKVDLIDLLLALFDRDRTRQKTKALF